MHAELCASPGGVQPLDDSATATAEDGRWPGIVFLTGFLVTAGVYGCLVYLVNPVRDFAHEFTTFPAVRSDYRTEKIQLLDRFVKARGPVHGVILGSSRSMLLSGERLERLSEGGRSYFNFGLASAKGEDFLAALRWIVKKQKGQMPRHVIIGVDIESLRDSKAHGDSVHPLRDLAVGAPTVWERSKTLLSRTVTWSYALDTALSVYLRLFPRQPAVAFASDGTLQYTARDQSRVAGTFSIEAGMAGCMADCRSKIETTTELSPSQVEYLRETIREAQAGGAEVSVWLTGPHPRTAAHMAEGTAYLALVRRTRQLLAGLGPAVRVYDLHDQSSYGGDSSAWYDCNHFDVSHARQIERILTASGDRRKGGLNVGF